MDTIKKILCEKNGTDNTILPEMIHRCDLLVVQVVYCVLQTAQECTGERLQRDLDLCSKRYMHGKTLGAISMAMCLMIFTQPQLNSSRSQDRQALLGSFAVALAVAALSHGVSCSGLKRRCFCHFLEEYSLNKDLL